MSVVGIVRYFAAAVVAMSTAYPCSSAEAGQRMALVIGNSAYQHTSPLANPVNDAEDLAKTLSGLGFQVTKSLNLSKVDMDRALTNFALALKGAEVGLSFYAGHGLQVFGRNYLVPVDAKLDAASTLDFETVRLDVVQRLMEQETQTNVLFLDACRDNPLTRNLARAMGTRSSAIGRGLAPQESGAGTIISYSTQPGNVALDSTGGRNSPFVGALVKHLPAEGRDLSSILVKVRNDVMAATAKRQVPWEHSALTDELVLVPRSANAPAIATAHGATPVKPGGSPSVSRIQTSATSTDEAAKPELVAKSAPASDVVFSDSFDGNTLGKHWTVKNEDPDGYLVEKGALHLVSSKPGGIFSARNAFHLHGVELEGDWDISVRFRPQFSSGNDQLQIGLVNDNDALVWATFWHHEGSGCSRLGLDVHRGGVQEAGYSARVRAMGCSSAGQVSKEEFGSIIDGLLHKGGTLTFSKRDRTYYATFTSPLLGEPVVTQRITMLRASGRPALSVSQHKGTWGQTSAWVDEFRITRGR